MARITQQVWGVAGRLGVAAGLLAAMACEGAPARSKPWLHPRADASPQVSQSIAPVVAAAEKARQRHRSRRGLVVHVARDPGPLDPLRNPTEDVGWLTRGTVFESLFVRQPDGSLAPRLAAAAPPATAALHVEIPLAPGIRFHDGRPLTGADVRFSIDSARAGGGPLARDLGDLAAVEVPGPDRIRLRLRRPNHHVIRALAEIPIASAASYYAAGKGANPRPAGTGPYRIAEDGRRLERWPEYRGAPAPAPWIEPRLEADRSRAVALAQVGEIDVLTAVDPERELGSSGALIAVELEPARFRFLAFNGRRELFSDSEVRRAAALAIDRRELAADGHRGRAVSIAGPMWPGGAIDGPAAPVPAPDRRAAAELLDRSGWVKTAGRARERDGRKLLAVVVTGEAPDPARDLLLDQLREAGFVLDVRPLASAELEAAIAGGAFDLALLEWRGHPDWDLSPLLEKNGRLLPGGISSVAIDTALAGLRTAGSPDARHKGGAALAAALEAAVPLVVLTAPRPVAAIGDRVVRGEGGAGARLSLAGLGRRPFDGAQARP